MECPLLSLMNNLCAKRCQRQLGDFEELFPEGNPDHRTAPEETDDQVVNRHPQSAANDPDHIGQCGNRSSAIDDLFSEGPEGQAGKFEALPSQRDTDDRHTADQSRNQP